MSSATALRALALVEHLVGNEHLGASAGVDGIEAFYERCVANGVTITKAFSRR